MANSANNKLKLLHTLEFIKRNTDENNAVTVPQITRHLESLGISAERKSVYDTINNLIDFGFDIIKATSPARGYMMASREFEQAEICLLTDAVQAAGFISRKKSAELIGKLGSLLSDKQAAEVRERVFILDRKKTGNEEVYYNVDKAGRAITNKKKITFSYIKRGVSGGSVAAATKQITLSPYAIIWANDHYYLVGNVSKYDNLAHFRIDRMKSVEVLPDASRHFSEVSDYKNFFDTADYSQKSFNMFGGEVQGVTLRCKCSLLDQVIDRFGEDITIKNPSEEYFTLTTEALISEGLVAWILQYGSGIEVLNPPVLRDMVSTRVKELYNLYS